MPHIVGRDMTREERELRIWLKAVVPWKYNEYNKLLLRMRKSVVEECAKVVEEGFGDADTGRHPVADVIRRMM